MNHRQKRESRRDKPPQGMREGKPGSVRSILIRKGGPGSVRTIRIRKGGPGFALPVWALLAGLPMLLLAGLALARLLEGDGLPLSDIIPRGRRLALFGETLAFSFATACFGTTVSLFAAGAVRFSTNRPFRGLPAVILPMAVLPPYLHALTWNAISQDLQALFRLWHWPALPQEGFPVSVWVQTLALLPFAFGMLWLGFRGIPDDVTEAARLLGSDTRTLLRVLLPLQVPALTAAFLFLFLVSLLDYSIPSLFQLNLYSLTLFAEYSIRYDAAHAFWLSVPLLAVSLPCAWGLMSTLRRLPLSPSRSACDMPLRVHPLLSAAALGACLILSLQTFAPLISLFIHALPAFREWDWLRNAGAEMAGTVLTGMLAAVVTLPFAWAAADAIHTRRRGYRLWWGLLMLPLAMPAPLIGVGLIQVWNSRFLAWTGLYGTLLMPALGAGMRFLPLSMLLLLSAMKRMDPQLTEAAQLLQRSSLQGFLRVRLPLTAGPAVGAALLMMVLSFGELGATLLLLPPGADSLTVMIYNYLHYGQSDVVAGLCLVMYLLALATGLCLAWLMADTGHRRRKVWPIERSRT